MTGGEATRKTIFREAARDISGELAAESRNAGSVGAAQGHWFQDRIDAAVDQIVYSAQVLLGENGEGNVIPGAWDPERDEEIGRAIEAKRRRDDMRLVA